MNNTGKKFGGRTKGTPNKHTKDLRGWITGFIDKNTTQIEQDWQALEPKDRIVMFEKLLKYTVPQLQAVSTTIDWESLSDEQLLTILNSLTKQDK